MQGGAPKFENTSDIYDDDVDSIRTQFSQRKKNTGKNHEKRLFKGINRFVREAKDSKDVKTSDYVKDAIRIKSIDLSCIIPLLFLILIYFCAILTINYRKYPTQLDITKDLANHIISSDYYSWQIYGFVYTNYFMDNLRNLRDGVYKKDDPGLKIYDIKNWYTWSSGYMGDGISYSYIPEKLIAEAMYKINFTFLAEYDDWAETQVSLHQYYNSTTGGKPTFYKEVMGRAVACAYFHVRMNFFDKRNYETSTTIPYNTYLDPLKDPEEHWARLNNLGN